MLGAIGGCACWFGHRSTRVAIATAVLEFTKISSSRRFELVASV